jgi:hypothetical protein
MNEAIDVRASTHPRDEVAASWICTVGARGVASTSSTAIG